MTVAMSAVLNIRRISVEGQCSLNCRGFFCVWFSWGGLFVCLFVLIFRSHGFWDLRFSTRSWTQALGNESLESQPLDHQGIPSFLHLGYPKYCWNYLCKQMLNWFFFNISFHFENAYIMSPLGNLKIKEVLFTTEIKAIFFFWNQMLWKYESVVKFLLHFCNINTWFQSLLKENLYDIQREFLKAIPLGQTLMCISV